MTDSDIRLGLIYLQVPNMYLNANKKKIQVKDAQFDSFMIMRIITIFIDNRMIVYNFFIKN